MELVEMTTEHLNPYQIPLLLVAQPFYDLAKMQWSFHKIFGEDNFVVMQGGLHIEKALWSTMGYLLLESGSPERIWASEDTDSSNSYCHCT